MFEWEVSVRYSHTTWVRTIAINKDTMSKSMIAIIVWHKKHAWKQPISTEASKHIIVLLKQTDVVSRTCSHRITNPTQFAHQWFRRLVGVSTLDVRPPTQKTDVSLFGCQVCVWSFGWSQLSQTISEYLLLAQTVHQITGASKRRPQFNDLFDLVSWDKANITRFRVRSHSLGFFDLCHGKEIKFPKQLHRMRCQQLQLSILSQCVRKRWLLYRWYFAALRWWRPRKRKRVPLSLRCQSTLWWHRRTSKAQHSPLKMKIESKKTITNSNGTHCCQWLGRPRLFFANLTPLQPGLAIATLAWAREAPTTFIMSQLTVVHTTVLMHETTKEMQVRSGQAQQSLAGHEKERDLCAFTNSRCNRLQKTIPNSVKILQHTRTNIICCCCAVCNSPGLQAQKACEGIYKNKQQRTKIKDLRSYNKEPRSKMLDLRCLFTK